MPSNIIDPMEQVQKSSLSRLYLATLMALTLILWRCTAFAFLSDYLSVHLFNTKDQTEISFFTQDVPVLNGYAVFHELIKNFLESKSHDSGQPVAVFIAESIPATYSVIPKGETIGGLARKPCSVAVPVRYIEVGAGSTSMMSIGAAVIKSTVGTIYYFHYLPSDIALVGSIFSSVHSLIFTSFPLAERALLLDPIKRTMRIPEKSESNKAKTIDLISSSIHRLFNLTVVTTIINWTTFDPLEIIKDATVSALVYSLIKNLWKINLDYRLRAGRINQRPYFFTTSALELAAWGLMPAVMLDQTWATTLGAGMAATGFIANAIDSRRLMPRNVMNRCEFLLRSIKNN